MKVFEDINLLGCDAVWVCPDISNDSGAFTWKCNSQRRLLHPEDEGTV